MLKAEIVGGKDTGVLSFNEIIGFTPGSGRGDAQKGTYENIENGNVLVVYSVNPQLVDIQPRKNGKRTNRTGKTRTGMFMVGKATGVPRLVTCDDKPDGEKKWRPFNGTITIVGSAPGERDAGDE